MIKYALMIVLVLNFIACAQTGKTGAQGPKGDTGLNGSQGPTGEDGAPGANGNDGTNGTDATPVTSVQFCAGYTSSYPSVFPEQGLCLANKLYGVYWMGGSAWLGEIPPGHYASTSTSAPCTFDVLPNCQISH